MVRLKEKQSKKMNKKEGITLISLVITVIIMLILAGVSISALIGSDGLFSKASRAVKQYENAAQNELDIIDEILRESFGIEDNKDKEAGKLDGAGTEESPYLIESIEDLVSFSQSVENGKDYQNEVVKLAVNLDFNRDSSYVDPLREDYGNINGINEIEGLKLELTTGGGFIPIGIEEGKSFKGTFDGGGHTLNNLYMNKTAETTTVGLFGYIENANIKNLTVTGNITAEGVENVGGIVGFANGIKIEKVNNKINIENKNGETINSKSKTGGILGVTQGNNKIIIDTCCNKGKIEVNDNSPTIACSGIIAESNNAELTISNTDNYGDISVNVSVVDNAGAFIGGMLAYPIGITGKISNCHNYGIISSEYSGSEWLVIAGITANIEGSIGSSMLIENCSNNKELIVNINGSPTGIMVGGIAGQNMNNNLSILNNSNSGKIETNLKNSNGNIGDSVRVGGILASTTRENGVATIIDCYNEGDIEAINESTLNVGAKFFLAGILGKIISSAGETNIINSCNVGNIKGDRINGIVYGAYAKILYMSNVYNAGDLVGSSLYGIGQMEGATSASERNVIHENIYYKKQEGVPVSNTSIEATEKLEADMKTPTFVDELNANRASINLENLNNDNLDGYTLREWVINGDNYPTFK